MSDLTRRQSALTANVLGPLRAKVALLARKVNREKQARRGGLIDFVRYFWHVLEPNTPLVEGWALYAICEHLEAAAFGEITRLLITVPPGFCKSLLTDVFFPAWLWSAMSRPGERFVAFSYAASLTERDNGKFRDLLLSREFQDLWGDQFKLRKIGETKVSNNRTGWKLATSVKGVGTGERGNFVILDDPHSIKEAESDPIRTETVRWFREAMSNRLNNMEIDCIIVIMQRSHYQDVAGTILEPDDKMGYCHLSIEMEFDAARQTVGVPNEIGWTDPRIHEGELAWPERFSQSVCDKLRGTIGIYAWAAQYQQMPTPRGGGILKRDWWRLWDQQEAVRYGLQWSGGLREFPPMELIIGSLDTAYGEKEENSLCALSVFGIWLDANKNRRAMLMHCWAKRLPLHGEYVEPIPGEGKLQYQARRQEKFGLVEWVAHTCKRYKVKRLLIEDKTRGRDVNNELRRIYVRENWGIELILPCRDKTSRAHGVVPIFSDGAVWAPETKWSDLAITQCMEFPKSAHNDIVDTITMALNWLRENDLIMRGDEMSAIIEDEMAFKPPQDSVAMQYGVAA